MNKLGMRIAFLLLIWFNSFSQENKLKEKYLLDTLLIHELTKQDKTLIDSMMYIYHNSVKDDVKLTAIQFLTEHLYHETTWSNYNLYLEKVVLDKLENKQFTDSVEYRFYINMIGTVYNNKGYLCGERGNNDKQLYFYLKSLQLRESIKDTFGIAQSLNNIGYVYEHKGDLGKGMEYYFKSLHLREKIKDYGGVGDGYTNIGFIYKQQGDFDQAMKFYLKGLEAREKDGNVYEIANSLNNIGTLYYRMGNYTESIIYAKRSLNIRKKIEDKRGIAECYNNLGAIHKNTVQYDSALYYYYKGAKLWEKLVFHRGLVAIYSNISDIYNEKNENEKAISYANKSLKHARKSGEPSSYEISYNSLYKTSLNKQDFKQALNFYEKYIIMRDSIINDKNQKEVIRQQTKFEFEKAQLVAEQQRNEELRIKNAELRRRDNLQYSIILIGILFLALIIPLLSGVWGGLKVSPKLLEGLIFFAFLILFEFLLVLSDPYVEGFSGGEPMYKLLLNALLAGLIFPAHSFFERLLKHRLIKIRREQKFDN